ncbi:hypothetical protein OsJ_12738 [Oryza sativa Japonica Group]|uniref:Uncharacterized protein n=1 Tax=Oryza sativa subsp. japonica TaxID=39947 RepID=A3AN30_ORYSJ|nr:hypothetical protein OsJ_12738 [Oryza sativa Japonica Group]
MTSGFGFTPWAADTCPTLEQLMASSASPSPSSSYDDNAAAAEEENGEVEEEEERRRQRRKVSNRLSARRSRGAEAAAAGGAALEERPPPRREPEPGGQAARPLAPHGLAARCQNARLRAEAAALARRLLALQRLARGRHMMITASPPQFSRR